MCNIKLLLLVSAVFLATCTKEEVVIGPLEVTTIMATRSNGLANESIDLLTNEPSSNIVTSTDFVVTFDRPVMQDWLDNHSLPRILQMENGQAIAGVTLTITSPNNASLLLSPNQDLNAGDTYQLVINPGYTAVDGGTLDENVIVNFTTL